MSFAKKLNHFLTMLQPCAQGGDFKDDRHFGEGQPEIHKFSASDAVSGTYMFDGGRVRQPDELNNKRTGYDSRRQVFTLHEAHTFGPQLLNSFHFGINRVVTTTGLNFPSGNSHVSDPSLGTVPGLNAAAVIVPGLTFFSGGLETPSNFHFHWTSIQASEELSLSKGVHSFKFGMNLERIRDNMLAISNPGGEFAFSLLSDFLSNRPFSLSAAIPGTISERGLRQTIVGTYVQDDWRWRPNVTINLGLRYEMATVPTEVRGKLTVLRHNRSATASRRSFVFESHAAQLRTAGWFLVGSFSRWEDISECGFRHVRRPPSALSRAI